MNQNNPYQRACAFIGSTISQSEKIAIGGALRANALKFWATLTACHTNDGPITQINLICKAMNIRAANDTLMTMIDNISILMECGFAMGSISNDTLTNFAILHSLIGYISISILVLYPLYMINVYGTNPTSQKTM